MLKMKLNQKERKFYELATTGGKAVEDAMADAYHHTDRKTTLTVLRRKEKDRPELFKAIADHKSELFEKTKDAQREAFIKAATKNALTAIEKREILRGIIMGEITEGETLLIEGKPVVVQKALKVSDRIKAMDVDNRMTGDYPPVTQKHGFEDSFLDFFKSVAVKGAADVPDYETDLKTKKTETDLGSIPLSSQPDTEGTHAGSD
jgi:hypothetical protein